MLHPFLKCGGATTLPPPTPSANYVLTTPIPIPMDIANMYIKGTFGRDLFLQ